MSDQKDESKSVTPSEVVTKEETTSTETSVKSGNGEVSNSNVADVKTDAVAAATDEAKGE